MRLFKKAKRTAEQGALDQAMLHLRKVSAGETSYSGSVSRIDEAWADIVLERIELFGFTVTRIESDSDGNPAGGDGVAGSVAKP